MLEKMKLKTKINTTMIGTIAIIYILVVLLGYVILEKNNKNAAELFLLNKQKSIENNIKRVAKKALGEASFYASLEDTKNAYLKFHETNDIQKGSKILDESIKPLIIEQEKLLNKKIKIHFHLPPARSFDRMWTDKRGDELSSFRKTILKISETKAPVIGIEAGRAGLVIRGLAPIFHNGKYLGDVESIYNMGTIYKVTNRDKNKENIALYMNEDLLSITTKFKSSNVNKNSQNVAGYIFVSKSKDFETKNIIPEMIDNGKLKISYFEVNNFIYATSPIKDFNGNTIAVMLYQYDITEMKSNLLNLFLILSGIGIFIAIIGVVFMSIITSKSIIKPIERTVAVLKDIVETKDFNKRLPMNNQKF